MPTPLPPKVKAALIQAVAAVLLALSASAALADAADRDYPDNPIMAEQYFHDHAAERPAASGQTGPAMLKSTPARTSTATGKKRHQ
jgi:hypothetical protein